MNNYQFCQDDLELVTKELFREAINAAYGVGITSIAPLGMSGDHFVLHGKNEKGRFELVSIRLYNESPELLITDQRGAFLFYGKFDIRQGFDFCLDQLWMIFNAVKHSIKNRLPDMDEVKISKGATKTIGFAMIESYKNGLL